MLAKIPAAAQTEIKTGVLASCSTPTASTSTPAPSWWPPCRPVSTRSPSATSSQYPAAVRCLLTDRDQLTSYLRFPVEHHRRIRHSNFIERTFGETRRRVKVIGRLPGEASCLSLVYAVLDRASRGWRGMTTTPAGLRLLHDLRRQLLDPPTQLHPPADAQQPETVAAVA